MNRRDVANCVGSVLTGTFVGLEVAGAVGSQSQTIFGSIRKCAIFGSSGGVNRRIVANYAGRAWIGMIVRFVVR